MLVDKLIDYAQISLKNVPLLGRAARFAFHETPFYKKRIVEMEKQRVAVQQKNDFYLNTVLNGDLTVRYGPFQGMRYIPESYGSALIPKIVGSYEEPIHQWIEEIPQKNYQRIIDIGCAEGYYAVGFAMRGFASEIIAIDTNKRALISAMKLATRNNLKTKLDFVNIHLTPDTLNTWLSKNTLIFCDIDGVEAELLRPDKAQNLHFSDIILETHDCFRPCLTELMIKRFSRTHRIEIIVDYPRLTENYPLLPEPDDLLYLFAEHRPDYQRWMKLTAYGA